MPDVFAFAEARADLDRLFDKIPENQTAVLRATRVEGLSAAEAAERLGIGEPGQSVGQSRAESSG